MRRFTSRRIRGVRAPFARVVAVATAAAFAASCVMHSWRPVPLTEVSVESEKLPKRRVRMLTKSGWVGLEVTSVAFPFVEGRVKEGTGEVLLDLRTVTRFGEQRSGFVQVRRPFEEGDDLTRKAIEFETKNGRVVLRVTAQEYPFVRGQAGNCGSEGCRGLVRVDLREVSRFETRSFNAGGTFVVTALGALGVLGTLFLIVLLTKESCPFVYVDRGHGFELAGEAYAGAAFRSLQRDDLLPIPAPTGSAGYHVVMRNEARETQYTDQAELVVVDHPTTLRVLSSFDGRLVRVGESEPPLEVRDLDGRDRLAEVTARDERLWIGDPALALAAAERPLRQGLVARFTGQPGGARPALEIVGGNTPWLDLVFGRFFAAMGDGLASYQAAWNEPAVGPGLRAWKDREGVDLRVELRAGDAWLPIAVVPTVGPMALRELAVPLPIEKLRADADVEVRLSGGTGFWRIDSVRLSGETDGPIQVRRLAPTVAKAEDGSDAKALLRATDGRYHALARMDENLDLVFDRPPLAPGLQRSLFFFSNGYYNVHPPLQSRHNPEAVRAIQREPGGLGRFSLALAAEYLARASRPRVAEARR